jgi:hypothetical protein
MSLMLSPHKVLTEYNKHDYLISGLQPVNRNEELTIIERDCVMVSKPARPSSTVCPTEFPVTI